jgi:hypothetical protein
MTIKIQQDNAKSHMPSNHHNVKEHGCSDGWNIDIVNQPPNSPDLNVLDLGFFNAIQTLQHEKAPTNIDELVTAVEEAYWDQEAETV